MISAAAFQLADCAQRGDADDGVADVVEQGRLVLQDRGGLDGGQVPEVGHDRGAAVPLHPHRGRLHVAGGTSGTIHHHFGRLRRITVPLQPVESSLDGGHRIRMDELREPSADQSHRGIHAHPADGSRVREDDSPVLMRADAVRRHLRQADETLLEERGSIGTDVSGTLPRRTHHGLPSLVSDPRSPRLPRCHLRPPRPRSS